MSKGRDLERRAAPTPLSNDRGGGASAPPPPAGEGLQRDRGSDLREYLRILVRRRRLAFGVFLAVVVGVLVGTLLQSPVYRATGLLEVRGHGTDGAPAQDLLVPGDLSEQNMRTQYELLRSAALSRRVIRDLELHRLPEFQPSEAGEGDGMAGEGPSPSSAAVLQRAVDGFQSRLTVDPRAESRLVELSFDFGDPEIAARVANAVLTNYVEMRAGTGREAATWLDTQMDSVRENLRASEQELRDYARENDLPYVVDEDVSAQIRERVRGLEEELSAAETDRYEKESLYNLVVGQGQFEVVEDRVVEELSIRLADLRREYARLSADFRDDYPPVRALRQQIEEVEALLDEEQQRIGRRIENDYRVAVRNEELLREALESERAAADVLAERSGPYHLLRREVLANRELFSALQQTRKQLEVTAALEATGVAIVDRAVPPAKPHRPLLGYNLALGMMAGMVLGIGGALLREFLDDVVRTEQEVGVAADLPVLALIPSFDSLPHGNGSAWTRSRRLLPGGGNGAGPNDRSGPPWARIDGDDDADRNHEAFAEAFGSLRTSMLFESDGRPPRSLLISSCQAGDGKTTVSLNLALSLSRLERKVLLVDGDLRRPCLHRALGGSRYPGLADYVADERDWRALVQHDERSGVDLLSAGRPVKRPGDLLSRGRMETLLEDAGEHYHFVLVDAPALFVNVPDARILSGMVAGVVVVVRSGATPRPLLERILEAAPNVLGVVVNDLHPSRFPDYYQAYPARSDEKSRVVESVNESGMMEAVEEGGIVEAVEVPGPTEAAPVDPRTE